MRKKNNSILMWKDYENFIIGDIKEKIQEGFVKKGFVSDDGKPNTENLKLEAENLANRLSGRIAGNHQMQSFGLQKIADNIKKIKEGQNLTELYFYVSFLYGAVYWRIPYNLQQLPAVPEALIIFMETFADIVVEGLENTDEPIKEEDTVSNEA